MTTRVLLVERDEASARSLARRLRALSDDTLWVTVETSPWSAIEAVDRHGFDVVVVEELLDGLTGVQVLDHARRRRPAATRLLSTCASDRDLALRAAEVAHGALERPLSAEDLAAVVEQTRVLRAAHASDAALRLTGLAMSLPSPATAYAAVLGAIDRGDIRAVADEIAIDPALSALLLRLVNSPFFGIRRRVSDCGEATMLLGLSTVRGLVLAEAVQRGFRSAPGALLGLVDAVQVRGERAALAARCIGRAARVPAVIIGAAATTALLRDVGALVVGAYAPECVGPSTSTLLADRTVAGLGSTVGEIGSLLLERWQLPSGLARGVAVIEQHEPASALDEPTALAVLAALVADGRGLSEELEAHVAGLGWSDAVHGAAHEMLAG